jgi:hypothetical protein
VEEEEELKMKQKTLQMGHKEEMEEGYHLIFLEQVGELVLVMEDFLQPIFLLHPRVNMEEEVEVVGHLIAGLVVLVLELGEMVENMVERVVQVIIHTPVLEIEKMVWEGMAEVEVLGEEIMVEVGVEQVQGETQMLNMTQHKELHKEVVEVMEFV